MMKVSILVPIYNAQKYIERCATSLFEQTYEDIEFVFVNDCTPDKSIGILKNVIEEFPDRKNQVKIIDHNKNRGVAAARNTLLKNATGDYILWVDSDDFIDKCAVEILVNRVNETNADIVCFGAILCKPSERIIIRQYNIDNIKDNKDFIANILSAKIPSTLWGKFIKRQLFVKHNITFVESLNLGEDLLVIVTVAYYANNIINEDKFLYYQDVSNYSSVSRTFSISNINSLLEILDKMETFLHDKFDMSSYIKIRKLDSYLRKLYYDCLTNNMTDYEQIKSQIKVLWQNNVRPSKRTFYDFFLICNFYHLNVLWAYIILWGKKLFHKANPLFHHYPTKSVD